MLWVFLETHFTTRMAQAEMTNEQEEAHDQINQLMNRLAGARVTLFKSKKAEDFQSVGMKCRECLLLIVKTFAQTQMVMEDFCGGSAGDGRRL